MRRLEDIKGCEYKGCENKAISIVFSRNENKVVACCDKHEDIVIDEGSPEYWDQCPNCDCKQGIN